MNRILNEISAMHMQALPIVAMLLFSGCGPKQGLGIEWIRVKNGPRGDVYISRTEVTFEQFDSFCAATGHEKPSDEGWGRKKRPVINVNFDDAQAFCTWLSQKIHATVRLPDDSEYVFAASGGVLSRGYKYSGSNTADSVAWYDMNSGGKTHEVATVRLPNELGIFDMSGNVWEWTRAPGSPADTVQFVRGGAWDKDTTYCAISVRHAHPRLHRQNNTGFRVIQE